MDFFSDIRAERGEKTPGPLERLHTQIVSAYSYTVRLEQRLRAAIRVRLPHGHFLEGSMLRCVTANDEIDQPSRFRVQVRDVHDLKRLAFEVGMTEDEIEELEKETREEENTEESKNAKGDGEGAS